MKDKYEEAFAEIVFAVSTLIYGDASGSSTINQNIVAAALKHHGVWNTIEALDPQHIKGQPLAVTSPK